MKNCCFTGHRNIKVTDELQKKVTDTIENLIQKGITDFYAGGAVGWDMMCENIILNLKSKYPHIRLHLVLPCSSSEQTAKWNDKNKKVYYEILKNADSLEYVSEKYFKGCMKKRNQKLISYADFCICFYNNKKSASGTGQTVRMALSKNISFINFY